MDLYCNAQIYNISKIGIMIENNIDQTLFTNPTIQSYREKIFKYFTNTDIAELLFTQLLQIHQLSSKYIFSLTVQTLHLFITFHIIDGSNEEGVSFGPGHGQYTIKITKCFPISGVRVHLLNNSLVPRIFDCRDLTQQILGSSWQHSNRIKDIFKKISQFQQRLQAKNNKYLQMQRVGQFIIGDKFDVHELKKFAAMEIFLDETTKIGPMLGTTQTHFLTFKQVPNVLSSQQKKTYQLYRVCQLQSISQIHHNKKTGEVIITFCRYKKIQSFHEHEKISKKYKVNDQEHLLRNILKNIGNYQKMQIELQLSNIWKSDKGNQKVLKKLEQSRELEQKAQQVDNLQQKKKIEEQLIKVYQKLIQFFSQRANAYYLIFVGKLNKLTLGQKG